MNPSPLRYPGGKYKLYKYVSELVKENKCTTYIEPFCGGAAIALELLFEGVVKDVIINDYDYTIFCFWNSILHETEGFVQLILDTPITMDEWHKQKAVRNELDTHSSLEIGFSTFFLNRTNRSGIIDKAGPIGGLNQQGDYPIDCRFNKVRLISQIQKIAEYKDHIMIYNMEALDFIEDIILKKRKSFVFFDPPYYGKGPGLYTNFYSHGDHANLANTILQRLKHRKWIVTYDNINAINQVLNYRDKLTKEYYALCHQSSKPFEVMSPKCVIIIGKISSMTTGEVSAFENFRNSLSNISILTFDELYQRIMDLIAVLSNTPGVEKDSVEALPF